LNGILPLNAVPLAENSSRYFPNSWYAILHVAPEIHFLESIVGSSICFPEGSLDKRAYLRISFLWVKDELLHSVLAICAYLRHLPTNRSIEPAASLRHFKSSVVRQPKCLCHGLVGDFAAKGVDRAGHGPKVAGGGFDAPLGNFDRPRKRDVAKCKGACPTH